MPHAVDELTRASAPSENEASEAIGYPEVVQAFNEIAEAISEDRDLDSLLHLVASRLCALFSIRRCSVYLKDDNTGLFRGKVAQANRNIDAAIKGLTAGIEADGFTREILQTKRPVLIVRAQSDPRPVHSTMLEWDVHTMLGVPMVLKGHVIGLLFLDNEDISHDYTEEEQALCGTFANLSAVAISHATLTSDLRDTVKTVEHQNTMLRSAAAIEERLATLVLEGADMREIAAAVSDLTGKPTVVLDHDLRPLASVPDRDDAVLRSFQSALREEETLVEAFAGLEGKRPRIIDAEASKRLAKRLLVAPVSVGEHLWGYLAVIEHGSWFNARDGIVARRAGTIIALELSAERRASEAEGRVQEALARDLLRGSDELVSLQRRADFQGMQISSPHVVCLISTEKSRRHLTPKRVSEALSAGPECRVLTAPVEEGVAAIVQLAAGSDRDAIARIKTVAEAATVNLGPEGAVRIAISGVCRAAAHYPISYREAQQVSHCIALYDSESGSGVLAADDLGAARLLLAGSAREEAEKFARDTIGVLLEDEGMTDLLSTLQVFFDSSRSVRHSAEALGVHENTIRYRLGRIEEATGMQVSGDADDQLTIQLALLILRLCGALPVSSGSGSDGPQAESGDSACPGPD